MPETTAAERLRNANPLEGVTTGNIGAVDSIFPPSGAAGSGLTPTIIQPHSKFLDSISTYAASIPLKTFWIVYFKIPRLITENNLNDLSEFFKNNDQARQKLSINKLMGDNYLGCIFCRSLNFSGEKNESEILNLNTRGFRSSPIAGSRTSNFLQNLTLSFYESTVSFIDHILRPWTVLMSYYSTLTRNPNTDPNAQLIINLRQDITCQIFTRMGVATDSSQRDAINSQFSSGSIPNYNLPPQVRKTIIFKNCFPNQFTNLDYVQQSENSLQAVEATFSYSNYEIVHGLEAASLKAD